MFARRGSQGETPASTDAATTEPSATSPTTAVPSSPQVEAPRTGRIAFVSSRDHLSPSVFVMNADGTNVTRLSSGAPGFGDSNPTWSPDGSLIAYESSTADTSVLMVVAPDGSGTRPLTEPGDGDARDPSWSPDGSRILFTSNRSGRNGLWTVDPDGSGIILLIDDASSPKWSPDGSRVAFSSFRDGDPAIYTIASDGTGLVRVTDPDGSADFDWSPDGTKIVFTCLRDGSQDICVVNADGTELVRLTDSSDLEFDPLWSPDGSSIAYRRAGASAAMYTMNPDGTGQHEVADAFHEEWSADGTWLVVSIDGHIYTMSRDGSDLVQLTDNEFGDSSPRLSSATT